VPWKVPKASSCFYKPLIINYFKRGRMAVGWKMRRQNLIIPPHSALILLSFHFQPFSRHSLGRDAVSRATGNGTVACKDCVRPETPRLNRIACKYLYIRALPENNQKKKKKKKKKKKSLFPVKSTWMPLGTKIICHTSIKCYKSTNYADITKIDLFPVSQNHS